MVKLRTLIYPLFSCLAFLSRIYESNGFIFIFDGSNFRLRASVGVSAAVLVGAFALIQGLQEKFNINVEHIGDELDENGGLFEKMIKKKLPILKGKRKHLEYAYNIRRNDKNAQYQYRKVYRYPRQVHEGLDAL